MHRGAATAVAGAAKGGAAQPLQTTLRTYYPSRATEILMTAEPRRQKLIRQKQKHRRRILMTSKQIGPFAQAWYKWKALRLPWRRRFLIGTFLLSLGACSLALAPSIRLQRHPTLYMEEAPFLTLSVSPLQASISKATRSGSSATPAGPRKPASAGDALSRIRDQRIIRRLESVHNGISGCGTHGASPRRWRSSALRWRARRG